MQFVDEIKIKILGGKGGKGVIRFNEDFGPSGGNGGDGGDIVFHASHNINTLAHLTRFSELKAGSGQDGQGSDAAQGKNGKDKIIRVPIGTIVKDWKTGTIIADLKKEGKYVIAKGGLGGRGNASFVTNRNKAPRIYENGLPGTYIDALVEIRVLADCGIIGFPSAGKSSFISIVSNAKPQIASYPFTTLSPVVGVINHKETRFIIADLPGLIEGASEGKGLGIKFLKHASRCKVLAHFVAADRNDYLNDYKIIRKELKKFSVELEKKPEIICISKCDVGVEKEKLLELESEVGKVIQISSFIHKNIDFLLDRIIEVVNSKRNEEREKNEKQEIKVIDLSSKIPNQTIYVKKEQDKYYVEGPGAEHMILRCPLDTDDNIVRFNYLLEKKKIIKKLKNLGWTMDEEIYFPFNKVLCFENGFIQKKLV